MMISAQTISVSSSRIPQPGTSRANSAVSLSTLRRRESFIKWSSGLRKGRGGSSTLATEQGSSLSSGAADSSDDGVPAKETGVHNFTDGSKIVEHMDPISHAKLESIVDDQLPSLLLMVIDGLPPLQSSKYVHEADKHLHDYVARHAHVKSLDSYCGLGLSFVSYLYAQVISVDRLVALAINYALLFVLDDFFFDTQDESLKDQYGISCDIHDSPSKIQEYLDHLDAIFSQQVHPSNPAPLIETLMWELGQDMLELSNTKWFRNYVASVRECHCTSVASHADIIQGCNLYFQDLESYTLMRIGNGGGTLIQMLIEFANNSYIPDILKATPYFKNVTKATSSNLLCVNDVFSYHKESLIEQNPRNLITVLMECEGKPFVQTVHRAIGLANMYARIVIDLETKAWNPILQNYLQNIKVLIAGNIYVSFVLKRYRHSDSCFLELKD